MIYMVNLIKGSDFVKNLIDAVKAAIKHYKFFLLIGVVMATMYSFGGLYIDITTVGINDGTYLAFLSFIGMPLITLCIGLVVFTLLQYIFITIKKG